MVCTLTERLQKLGIQREVKTELEYFDSLAEEVKKRVEEGTLKIQGRTTLLESKVETEGCKPSLDPAYCYETVYLSQDGTIKITRTFHDGGWHGGVHGPFNMEYNKNEYNMHRQYQIGISQERCSDNIRKKLEKVLSGIYI